MQRSEVLCGEVLSPKTIGDPIATEIIQTIAIVHPTRLLLLCLAYFIGLVTAMNLKVGDDKKHKLKPITTKKKRDRKVN